MRFTRRFSLGLALVVSFAGCGLGFGTIELQPPNEALDSAAPELDASEPREASLDDASVAVDAPPPPSCSDGVVDGDETDVDCGGAVCAGCPLARKCTTGRDCATIAVCGAGGTCTLPLSCKELLLAHPGLPDDVYRLANKARTTDYEAGCDMKTNGGGFTLLLKVDGTKNTFEYDSNLWTSTALLAANSPRIDDRTEAKLASYHEVALSEIALVFDADGGARRLVLAAQGVESLAALVMKGRTTTNLGRNAWLSLVPGSSLQGNCNAEGVSVEEGQRKLRIGILGNEFNGCAAPDSYVGIGSNTFCNQDTRAGNVACFNGSGGDRNKGAFARVFAR